MRTRNWTDQERDLYRKHGIEPEGFDRLQDLHQSASETKTGHWCRFYSGQERRGVTDCIVENPRPGQTCRVNDGAEDFTECFYYTERTEPDEVPQEAKQAEDADKKAFAKVALMLTNYTTFTQDFDDILDRARDYLANIEGD